MSRDQGRGRCAVWVLAQAPVGQPQRMQGGPPTSPQVAAAAATEEEEEEEEEEEDKP